MREWAFSQIILEIADVLLLPVKPQVRKKQKRATNFCGRYFKLSVAHCFALASGIRVDSKEKPSILFWLVQIYVNTVTLGISGVRLQLGKASSLLSTSRSRGQSYGRDLMEVWLYRIVV